MMPTPARSLRAGAARLGVEVPLEAEGRLERFLALLEEWNRRVHLTGDRDREVVASKHVLDCLAPLPHLPPRGRLVDIGSGAGFPGIVLACMAPELDVALVESRRRPATFLREVIRVVPLPAARVVESRAETAARDPDLAGEADVVISRGLRLDGLLVLGRPFLAPGGRLVAMQTPETARRAAALAAAQGLRLIGCHDYVLEHGERRTLLIFGLVVGD